MTAATGIALSARIRARHRLDQPWLHPAVAGKHVVTNTRDYSSGEAFSVATCHCGWSFRAETAQGGADQRDVAVHQHWRDVIAAGGLAA